MVITRYLKRMGLITLAISVVGIDAITVANAATALEEIVVVARKRAESLQEVPVAVTAFTARNIEDAGIESASDFLALTPNVTFVSSESAGVNFMTIRGLTQVRNGESPVAVVVDGVLMTDPGQFDQELFDIQQIEVLKGPQGALYGRNAIGGAINITSKAPSSESEGKVALGVGNGGLVKLKGAVGGALSDTTNYRFAASHSDRNGYLDNVYLGEKVDPYKETSLRGRLNWAASDRLDVDLRLSRSEVEGGSLNFVINADFNAFDFVGDANDTSVDFTANRIGVNERNITSASVKLDYDFDFATLTSVTGWDDQDEYYAASAYPYECNPACPVTRDTAPIGQFFTDAFGGTTPQVVKVFNEVQAVSQELRLTSNGDGSLRWIAGVYYLQTDRLRGLPTEIDTGVASQINVQQVFNSNTLFGFADDNDNKAYAAFGQLNYDLSDNFELSAALRYDRDERQQTNVAPAAFTTTQGLTRSKDFSEVQPKLTLKHRINDNLNWFLTLSEGFRSGGFNQVGIGAAAAAAGIAGISDTYEKEVSSNIEIGFKGEFNDGRTKLNGGVFRTDVEDQHFFQFVGDINAQLLNNIDEVEIRGVELDVQHYIGDDLNVYAALGITDSEIIKYTVDPTDVGNEAPYVPDSTFNVGFQYSPSLTDNVEGFIRVDLERRGEQFWETSNLTSRDSLDLVNLRFGARSNEGDWSLMAWVRNATDEIYNAEFVAGGIASRALPRTYGVDFTKSF